MMIFPTMKKVILIGLGVAALIVAAASIVLAAYAEDFVEKYRHDVMGLSIKADQIEVNWLSYGVTLKGVKIYPARKESSRNLLGQADEIRICVAPTSLLWHTLRLRSVVLERPHVNYVRSRVGHTNGSVLNMSWLKDSEKNKGTLGDWGFRVDKVVIKNGHIAWRDHVSGGRFELNNTEASLSDIVDEPDSSKLPSKIHVEGTIGKTKGSASAHGRVNLLAEGINFNIKANIKNAPITYFAPFYAGQVPFKIVGGTMSVSSNAKAKDSYLTSSHHATIRNLKVGGVQGKLINALVLREGNKVDVDAQVNGDLSKGNLRVSSQISRIMGGAILARAGESVPLREVGAGIKRAGEKTGDKIRSLFGR
jgi:uncharacterized protein involved in outer membrane biogenesis